MNSDGEKKTPKPNFFISELGRVTAHNPDDSSCSGRMSMGPGDSRLTAGTYYCEIA